MKLFIFPLVGFCSLLGMSQSGFAQKSWIGLDGDGGDGSWVSGNFASAGLPGSSEQVHFYRTTAYSEAVSDVLVNRGAAFTTGVVRIGRGKTVNFTLDSGTSWTTAAVVSGDKNITTQTGSGPSHVTFTANAGAGVLKVTQLVVGLDDLDPATKGSTLTFDGEHMKVEVNATTTPTIVGRNNSESKLFITGGANVTLTGLAIGQSQNDNRTEVTGSGSMLTIAGSTASEASTALSIGYTSASANVNGGNVLYIGDGGEVAITASGSNNHITRVGGVSALGGNLIEVARDGAFRTTGSVAVSAFATAGRGANGVLIRDGGTFEIESTTAKTMTVAGFVTLEDGGELSGNGALTIESGGVLRAAGMGLALGGETKILTGGMWEVGTSAIQAETLTLAGDFSMETSSTLRFSLLGDGSYDQIILEEGSSLLLSGDVVLALDLASGYTPAAGTVFTLFTGHTEGITGNFDVSQYDPALWDFSQFNETGDWKVVAIPEPSSVMLMMGAGALLLVVARRKQNKY